MEEDGKERKKLYDAAVKKAVGYTAVETSEEYAFENGREVLVKRKVTEKDVPPDINALKWLLGEQKREEVSREEIERERRELTEEYFRMLKENQTETEG